MYFICGLIREDESGVDMEAREGDSEVAAGGFDFEGSAFGLLGNFLWNGLVADKDFDGTDGGDTVGGEGCRSRDVVEVGQVNDEGFPPAAKCQVNVAAVAGKDGDGGKIELPQDGIKTVTQCGGVGCEIGLAKRFGNGGDASFAERYYIIF